MKRQLGCFMAAIGLMCVPLAWGQSTSSGGSGSTSSGGSSSTSTSGSSASSGSTSSGSASSDSSSSSASSNGSPSNGSSSNGSSQGVFTNWGANDQNGSGQSDQSQSGSSGSGDTGQIGSGNGIGGGIGGDNTQSGASGPQDTFGHPETLPPLNLFGDVASRTGLTLTTTVGNTLQYNTQSNAPGFWNNLSNFGGGIGISQVRSKVFWSLGYNGGINYTTGYQTVSYTTLNQVGSFRLNWEISPRWQFKIKDNYLYSDDPFSPFFEYIGQPAPNNPNPVLYFPQQVVEQNQATASLLYKLTAHDSLIFSGQESFQHYLRGSVSTLWNSTTYGGAVFLQHQFSPKLVGGGGYNFTALDFGHGESRAGINMIQGFVAYTFSPNLTVSGWVGPELTNSKDIIPVFCYQLGCFYSITHSSQWNVAEGGTVRWKAAANNFFGLDFAHQITNGGGLLGAVNFYQVTTTFSRPLTNMWFLNFGAYYSNSLSISQFAANQYLDSLSGAIGVGRKLFNNHWTANAYVALIDQKQNYVGLPSTVTTSGLGVTLSYAWNHALGGW